MLATGGSFTVRDFVEASFTRAGLEWEKHVKFDPRYLRPTEVDALIGDPGKANDLLGWKPNVLTPRLAQIMVDADVASLEMAGSRHVDVVETS